MRFVCFGPASAPCLQQAGDAATRFEHCIWQSWAALALHAILICKLRECRQGDWLRKVCSD